MARWLTAALLCLQVLCGCRPHPPSYSAAPAPAPTPPHRKPGVKPLPEMPARNNRFAFELFGKLRAERPHDNLFVSPFSVSAAIAMAYYGAGGATATAIARTMHWEQASPDEVNAEVLDLKYSIQSHNPRAALAMADSMWMKQGISFKPGFVKAIGGIPGVKIATLDFGDRNAARVINGWVNEQTRGLIPTITNQQELQRIWLVLLDAIYFKARWEEVFEKSSTEDAPFTLLDGRQKTVPMMAQMSSFRYLQTSTFQAIRLPYEKGSIAMYVFLPAKGSSLQRLLTSLTSQSWGQWLGKMDSRLGTIKLPRFTAKNTVRLNEALSALGMRDAFAADKADFSGMCDDAVFLSIVKQKSYVRVDEEGTEAAAVTMVPGAPGIAGPPGGSQEPFQMIVDRPFFLAIEDSETKTILFMGAIVDPEEG